MSPTRFSFAQIAAVFSLLLQVSAASNQVRHLEHNHAYLVDTGPSNWALSSPALAQTGWKSVSLNKDKVIIWTSNCQTSVKTPQELSAAETTLINSVRNQMNEFQSAASSQQQQQQQSNQLQQQQISSSTKIQSQQQQTGVINQQSNFAYSSSSIDGSRSQLVADHPIDSLTYNNQQITTDTKSESFSIAKSGLPNNLAQVFVDNDLITYVYANGDVLMKPTGCLAPEELEFMNKLKKEVDLSQRQMGLFWNDFEQKMQQAFTQNLMQQDIMQQDMQRSMLANFMPYQQQPYREPSYRVPDYSSLQQQQQQYGQLAPYYNQFQQPSSWMQNQVQPRSASGFAMDTGLPNPYLGNLPQLPNSNFFNNLAGPNYPFYGPF